MSEYVWVVPIACGSALLFCAAWYLSEIACNARFNRGRAQDDEHHDLVVRAENDAHRRKMQDITEQVAETQLAEQKKQLNKEPWEK